MERIELLKMGTSNSKLSCDPGIDPNTQTLTRAGSEFQSPITPGRTGTPVPNEWGLGIDN
jgi:hypothetical protein